MAADESSSGKSSSLGSASSNKEYDRVALMRDNKLLWKELGLMQEEKAKTKKEIEYLRKERDAMKDEVDRLTSALRFENEKAAMMTEIAMAKGTEKDEMTTMMAEIAQANKIKQDEVALLLMLDRAEKDQAALEVELRKSNNDKERLVEKLQALELKYAVDQGQNPPSSPSLSKRTKEQSPSGPDLIDYTPTLDATGIKPKSQGSTGNASLITWSSGKAEDNVLVFPDDILNDLLQQETSRRQPRIAPRIKNKSGEV